MSLLVIIVSATLLLAAVLTRYYRAVPAASLHPIDATHRVVTDLRICFHPRATLCACKGRHSNIVEKDLFLHQHPARKEALLVLELREETELAVGDLIVTAVTVGERPLETTSRVILEDRHGNIWLSKQEFRGDFNQVVRGVDVLYGEDAVDPRPQWELKQSPLQLNAPSNIPVARLSIRHGKHELKRGTDTLRMPKDGKFKIIQISDTHMSTGVGTCKDAMHSDGTYLTNRAADPLTVAFIGKTLDEERGHLVVLTGDQVHHDVHDTQTALFKAVAPMIARETPFVAVFGNHDSEGRYALSRE